MSRNIQFEIAPTALRRTAADASENPHDMSFSRKFERTLPVSPKLLAGRPARAPERRVLLGTVAVRVLVLLVRADEHARFHEVLAEHPRVVILDDEQIHVVVEGRFVPERPIPPPPQNTGWLVSVPYSFVSYPKIGLQPLVTASPRLVSRPPRVISILFAVYENCSVLVALLPSV